MSSVHAVSELLPRENSLLTLPPELITQIASYLSPVDSHQLTQTCKPLQAQFQPILFRTYSNFSSHPISRLIHFLRAIVTRPDLAAAVTHLTFHDPLPSPTLTTPDIQFIETCLTDLGLSPPPKNWHLEGETRQIPLQTLVAYTPNLHTLDIPVNEDWSLDIFDTFPLTLPRLRTLSIHYYYISGDGWAIPADQILPLLEAAPNIEHLTLATTLEGFYEGSALPPLSSVKTLNLDENASGAFLLTSLITGCPSLQSFKLHWLRSTGYDESHEDWSISELWEALVQAPRLQEITFDSSTDIPLGHPTGHSVSSLAALPALTVLRVDGRSIETLLHAWRLKIGTHQEHDDEDAFVTQLLPPGITTLTIWDPSYLLIPVLFALARARSRGLYASLARVEIGPSPVFKHWMPRPEWGQRQGSLRSEFGRVGVVLEMEVPEVEPEMLSFLLQGGFVG